MLGHTVDWLRRKYEQAIEEKHNASRERSIEGFSGLMLLVDGLLNQGKGFNDIVPTFAELNKQKIEKPKEEFVAGNWWESE